MMLPAALLLLGALTAVFAPGLLSGADWPDREPVVALWVRQCVVAAVPVCCALSLTFSAAASHAVGGPVFVTAPRPVVEAHALGTSEPWTDTTAVALAGAGLWSAVMPAREVVRARSRRRRRRAELLERVPVLPGEVPGSDPLVVLEGERPDAWCCPALPRNWSSPRLRCGA